MVAILLLLLVPVQAHENRDPAHHRPGFVVVLEDCDDDYGWHGQDDQNLWPLNNQFAHDHETVDLTEDKEEDQYMLIFFLVLTYQNNPDDPQPENDRTTEDELRFKADGVPFTTVVESSDEENFMVIDGEVPAYLKRVPAYLEEGVSEDPDPQRFGLEMGYTYHQLGLEDGDDITDFGTTGRYHRESGDPNNPPEDDGFDCQSGLYGPGNQLRLNAYTVDPAPPVVDITIEEVEGAGGDTFRFAAEQTDGAGNITVWAWDFGDGENEDGPEVEHTYADSGTFQVTLQVTDDLGSTTTFTDGVTTNSPPVAAFTFQPSAPLLNETVQFTDTSSDDSAVTSWQWDLGDGTTSTEQHPDHTYTEADDQVKVTLTVTDDDGATATKEHFLQVRADEEEEIIEFSEGPTAAFDIGGDPTAGEEVTFIDQSTDPDDGIDAWAWDFGDGGTSTEQDPTHTYTSASNFTVTLTVTDAGGLEATTSQNLEILEAQQDDEAEETVRPVADFEAELVPDSGGQTYRFHDRSSHAGGQIVSWAWTFGDGTTSTEASPEHTYQQFGPFTVRLVVTDAAGLKDAAFQLVTVVAPDEDDNESPVPVGAALTAVGAALFLARRNRRP